MKKIRRNKYLQELINSRDIPTIKVITGIRRSGKSEILKDYIVYLNNDKDTINIVFINFQDLDNDNLKEYHLLNEYILNKYCPNKKTIYLLMRFKCVPDLN